MHNKQEHREGIKSEVFHLVGNEGEAVTYMKQAEDEISGLALVDYAAISAFTAPLHGFRKS